MLSPNKNNLQHVHQMKEKEARQRALKLLNQNNPQYPPDIYFIRRNHKMLLQYLDQSEMQELISRVEPKMKENYGFFKLEPSEKDEFERQLSPIRTEKNPNDPFYKRPVFRKNHASVFDTNKILQIIKPFNHDDLLNKSKEEIIHSSRRLMSKYLDREKAYYKSKQTELKPPKVE